MASITLVELTTLNKRINTTNIEHKRICVFRRSFSSSDFSMISTQKLVVRAVRAESALLNDAATIPIVNSITTVSPNFPEAANIGRSESPDEGRGLPVFVANITSYIPSPKKRALAGTKAKP